MLLFGDLVYTFSQYYQTPLDGDLPAIVTPTEPYEKVLTSPFGEDVIFQKKVYPATNRFFTHAFMYWYFRNVPVYLQRMVSPIDSPYLACAILKMLTELLLLYLFYVYIKGRKTIDFKDFVVISLIVVPFFQTYGYQATMGIVNAPITYFCFYSLTSVLFLVPFIPFFLKIMHDEKTNLGFFSKIIIIALLLVLSLTSSLLPSISIIICPIILFFAWKKEEGSYFEKTIKLCKSDYVLLLILLIFSVYSSYLGLFNRENFGETIPLLERYARIPKALFRLLTLKLGLTLLIVALIINVRLIKKFFENEKSSKIIGVINWATIFTVLYIVLIPLGGYREYRPDVVGKDVLTPILIILIFCYTLSTYFLVNSDFKYKNKYLMGVICISIIFTLPDFSNYEDYKCERNAFEQISMSKDSIVVLENQCNVMEWHKKTKVENSESRAKLLQIWNITKENKLFYQK